MEDKLAAQVCMLAGTCRGALKPEAVGFLRRRTQKWVADRKVTSEELEKAAADLARRYPSSITGRTTSRAASAMSKPQTNPPAPPINKRSVSVAPESLQASEIPSGQGRESAMSGASRNDSPSLPGTTTPTVIPTRPAVVKRLLDMTSNQKWQNVIQSQVAKFEAEEAANAERRRQTREQMRKDMAEAERYRLQKEQERRKEREENRLLVLSVVKEVEEEEKLKVVAHREKELRERADMEQQRLDKIKHDSRRKIEAKQENAEIRRQIAEDIALYEEEQMQHAIDVKHSIKRFLDDSKRVADERKAMIEAEQRKQRQMELAARNQPSAGEWNARLNERQHQMRLEAVRRRQQLQDLVSRTYSRLEEEQHQREKELEQKTMTGVALREKEKEQRQTDDEAKKLKMREKLVESLNREIEIRDARKREAEESKIAVRTFVDGDTEKYRGELTGAKQTHRRQQLQLCRELDQQISTKFQRLLRPQQLKITEVNPPVA